MMHTGLLFGILSESLVFMKKRSGLLFRSFCKSRSLFFALFLKSKKANRFLLSFCKEQGSKSLPCALYFLLSTYFDTNASTYPYTDIDVYIHIMGYNLHEHKHKTQWYHIKKTWLWTSISNTLHAGLNIVGTIINQSENALKFEFRLWTFILAASFFNM